ncbi:Zn-ribbon domain-containing protein [Halostella pelagica]|uniref:Zn-ribbon domain-containing protein n=1 Tax=Halostella pelagica TaxID=2583824 RepID=UPI0010802714|nr:Zn-ribbon containing protein [Halostella pelagica]
MPHQCTNCGRTFADGSKEMLSGCPDCGGNKFQFDPGGSRPAGEATGDADERTQTDADDTGRSSGATTAKAGSAASGNTTEASDDRDSGATGRVGRARETVQEWVGTDSSEASADASATSGSDGGRGDGRNDAERRSANPRSTPSQEDSAQSNARTDVVTRDELPDDPPDSADDSPATGEDAQVAEVPDGDQPDLSELREELNNQFESIKIVSPGHYELNLMELYDRDEYIISLKEDGRYVIEVPETWRSDAE